jgi:hypothetical protein
MSRYTTKFKESVPVSFLRKNCKTMCHKTHATVRLLSLLVSAPLPFDHCLIETSKQRHSFLKRSFRFTSLDLETRTHVRSGYYSVFYLVSLMASKIAGASTFSGKSSPAGSKSISSAMTEYFTTPSTTYNAKRLHRPSSPLDIGP